MAVVSTGNSEGYGERNYSSPTIRRCTQIGISLFLPAFVTVLLVLLKFQITGHISTTTQEKVVTISDPNKQEKVVTISDLNKHLLKFPSVTQRKDLWRFTRPLISTETDKPPRTAPPSPYCQLIKTNSSVCKDMIMLQPIKVRPLTSFNHEEEYRKYGKLSCIKWWLRPGRPELEGIQMRYGSGMWTKNYGREMGNDTTKAYCFRENEIITDIYGYLCLMAGRANSLCFISLGTNKPGGRVDIGRFDPRSLQSSTEFNCSIPKPGPLFLSGSAEWLVGEINFHYCPS